MSTLRGFMTKFNGFNVSCDNIEQTDWITYQLKGCR